MSATNETAGRAETVETEAGVDENERCASCGTAGGDDVTLKNCTACYLVKYCGVECQRNHRPEHKGECKRRAAELKDELLFKQPESTHLGDCPICLLPIPWDWSEKYVIHSCCTKIVCNGCMHAHWLIEQEGRLPPTCPFCRHPKPKTEEEIKRNTMKRAAVNDPLAVHNMGAISSREGDLATALKFWKKSAGLGGVESNHQLTCVYQRGHGVQPDMKKSIHHTEQAAIGGHPEARYRLGRWEEMNDDIERAVKHWMIAANLGHDESLEKLRKYYSDGMVSKEDFATALRAHKAAVDATKSPQREEGERVWANAGRFM
jgi:hypothetical protein